MATDPRITTATAVAPEFDSGGQIVAGSNNSLSRIVGTTVSWPRVSDHPLTSGEWFSEDDITNNRTVVVLGSKQAEGLFPAGDAVGQKIRINRVSFTVIGVLKAKGGNAFGSVDDRVYIPITTAQTKLFGPRGEGALGTGKTVSRIVMKAKNSDSVEKLIAQATDLLRERHKIQLEDDFQISNQQEQLQAARDQQNTLNTFLIFIASISLFVGGIGIMNIMLVTVTERTREIGIRKALGATPLNIMGQFLIESITLCLIGGIIGVILGVAASRVVNEVFVRTALSLPVILMAVGFAIGVGLFFGLYPARRAARLSPIEALRYE